MAPIVLHPDADTTISVVQKDGSKVVKRVELLVLTAALEKNSYWKRFLEHMSTAIGFRPNSEHIEDTGVSTTAVEIVLRALHYDFDVKLEEADTADQGGEAGTDGGAETDNSRREDIAVGGTDGGPASTMQEEQKECRIPADIGVGNTSKSQDSGLPTTLDRSLILENHFPKEFFEVSIDDVWGVLPLINFKTCGVDHKGKLDVDRQILLPWFIKWRSANFPSRWFNPTSKTQHDFECVLFPTFAFNDAAGWSLVTEWLCKRTSRGQIDEYSPFVFRDDAADEWYRHLHLPKEVISRIRVARSQLYVRMEREVSKPIHDWFSKAATCGCRVVAAYNYRRALQRAGVVEQKTTRGRPGEEDGVRYSDRLDQTRTVLELCGCLRQVPYEEPLRPCIGCAGVTVKSKLAGAIGVEADFGGLCLDCMEASLEIPGLLEISRSFPAHEGKITHYDDNRKPDWCGSCRVRHGHTTSYFSWVNPIPRQTVFPPPLDSRNKGTEFPNPFVVGGPRRLP